MCWFFNHKMVDVGATVIEVFVSPFGIGVGDRVKLRDETILTQKCSVCSKYRQTRLIGHVELPNAAKPKAEK